MHIGLPHRIKGRRGLHAILAKAQELEAADWAKEKAP
jgi:hypothetical protein